jgi:phage gp29-like protein
MSRKTKQFAAKTIAVTPKATAEKPPLNEISTVDAGRAVSLNRFLKLAQYNPDSLVGRSGLKIYREMRLDEQVKAALNTKKYFAISNGWDIVPPVYEGTDGKASKEITDFVRFNLSELDDTFEKVILNILTAMDFGFSCSEVSYRLINYGPYEGKYGLKSIKTRDPEHITFETDIFGNLLPNGVLQNGTPMDKDRFIIYSYNEEFNNYYGTSDLRAAHKSWFCKENLLKFSVISLQRYGEPIAVATTEKTLTPEERTRLEAIFTNLQSRTLILVPSWIQIKFEAPSPHTSEAFLPILNKLDTWIRIAIMLPGLLGMSAESGVGSFARADQEMDVFLAVLEQLRRDVEAKINDRVVKPLCDYNYEVVSGRYPLFKFLPINKEELRKTLDGLIKSAEVGLITKTPPDENVARKLLGVPEIDEASSEPMITKIAADAQAKAVEISATRTQQAGTASKTSKNFYTEEDIVRIVTENIQNGSIATPTRRSKQ